MKLVEKVNYQVDMVNQRKRYCVLHMSMLRAWQVPVALNLSAEDKSDGVEKTIWESEQCQSDLVIGAELSLQQKAELLALLATYKEVLNNAPEHTRLVEHHIESRKASQ